MVTKTVTNGPKMASKRAPSGSRAVGLRSAVTNKTRLFLVKGGDLSVVGRRLRDIRDAIASDLGGDDYLSEAQLQLIRRAATLAIHCEVLESGMAQGDGADMDEYATMTNVLRRVLVTLGLRRVPRDITPRLSDYLASKAEVAP